MIGHQSSWENDTEFKERLEAISAQLTRSAEVLTRTAQSCPETIAQGAQRIVECFLNSGKLLICGNGGSAAESQHMAAELTHRLSAAVERRALPALALTTDTSLLTACANDHGFEHVFERQVEALGRVGDVLLGISTSGSSPNVVKAFRQARTQGLTTIALVGSSGEMVNLADVAICIPDADAQSIQESQLAVIHVLCALVEQAITAFDFHDALTIIDQVNEARYSQALP